MLNFSLDSFETDATLQRMSSMETGKLELLIIRWMIHRFPFNETVENNLSWNETEKIQNCISLYLLILLIQYYCYYYYSDEINKFWGRGGGTHWNDRRTRAEINDGGEFLNFFVFKWSKVPEIEIVMRKWTDNNRTGITYSKSVCCLRVVLHTRALTHCTYW